MARCRTSTLGHAQSPESRRSVETKGHDDQSDIRAALSLSLSPGGLFLNLFRFHPAATDKSGRIGYFSERGSGARSVELLPKDQTLDVSQIRARRPQPKVQTGEFLKPGVSRTWSVAVTNLPANEYEVNIGYSYYLKKKKGYRDIFSNVLRFDVLADKPKSWQGLDVGLEPDVTRRPPDGRSIPMRLRFRNTGDQPLRFALRTAGRRWDVSSDVLVCYDARGTFLPLPTKLKGNPVQPLRLEKGKDLTIPVDLPGQTRTARVVFHHRFTVRKSVKPDERVLGSNIYVFSRHLLLPAGKGK